MFSPSRPAGIGFDECNLAEGFHRESALERQVASGGSSIIGYVLTEMVWGVKSLIVQGVPGGVVSNVIEPSC